MAEQPVRQYVVELIVTIVGVYEEVIDKHIVADRFTHALPNGTVRVKRIDLL